MRADWYDYGARFYDPALARWHVPDPLQEITQSWSPFRYAFNNPLRYIDPNGLTEYEITPDGVISEVPDSQDDSKDELYVVDADFNRTGVMETFSGGTFCNEVEVPDAPDSRNDNDAFDGEGTGYEIDNTTDAEKLYKFASDNTAVEFGLIESDKSNVVMTNHDPDAIALSLKADELRNNGENVTESSHSHPKNSGPSGQDKLNASGSPSTNHTIYNPGTGYIRMYNGSREIGAMPFSLYFQPPTIIESKSK